MKLSDRWASLAGDLYSGLRQLRAAPVLSAVLIATLGFGIGSTVSVFSIVHAVLLEPLPYLAIIALSLATIGIYGALAYIVVERVPEIGLRLALGARATSVVGLVLRQGVMLTLVGLTIGLGVARLASGVLRSLLFGVTPTDAATYVTGAVALFVVAAAAMTGPAVRASRIDPVRSLANEPSRNH